MKPIKIVNTTLIPHHTEPNVKGYMFSKECLKDIERQAKEKAGKIFGTFGITPVNGGKDLNKDSAACMLEDAEVDESGNLIGTIAILNTAGGKMLKASLELGTVVVRPCGVGEIKDKSIENYELEGLDAIYKEDDSFGAQG